MKTVSLVAAAAMISIAVPAAAATVVPVSAAGSTSFPGYADSFAIDGSNTTDWASLGEGAGSFLNLDLGAVYSLASISGFDRTTSGGGNGGFVGGTTDFTTGYSVQAYDATFTTALGTLFSFTKVAPASPTTISSFAFSGNTPGLVGRYIRYTVDAANGANPGLAEVSFQTPVPEPASWAMMITGFGLVGGAMRRRRRANTTLAHA